MTLVFRLIGKSCGQLTCLMYANLFSGLWLISHRALPVGKWLRRRGKDGACNSCNYDLELIEHCLWSYTYANMIWERIICILAGCGMKDSILFGYAIWWSLQKNVWMCGA